MDDKPVSPVGMGSGLGVGQVLGLTVPFLRYAMKRDGTLLPDYAEGRFIGSPYDRTLALVRRGREPEPLRDLEFLKVRSSFKYVKASSAGESRTLVLFENAFGNGELLLASESGHFFVRAISARGVDAFRDPTFDGNKAFWSRINPQIENRFIHQRYAVLSEMRFPELDAGRERKYNCESRLSELGVSILQTFLPDAPSASLWIRCATRNSRASVELSVPEANLDFVSPSAIACAAELAERLVDALSPYSERAESPDPIIGPWTTRKDAVWVAANVVLHGQALPEDLTAIERALLVPKLRADLEEMGVRCGDVFGRIAVS